MKELIYAPHTIGIHLSRMGLLSAHLVSKKEGARIQDLTILPLETKEITDNTEEEDVKRVYILNEQNHPFYPSDWIVVSSLPSKSVLVRNIEIPLTKETDVLEALPFQVESLLPFSLEEGVLDSSIITKNESSTSVTFAAVKNTDIEEHLDTFTTMDIEPEVLSSDPFALSLFSHHYSSNPNTDTPIFNLHIGLEESLRVFSQNGRLIASNRIPIGVSHLVHAYSKDKQCSYEESLSQLKSLDFSSLSSSTHPELFAISDTFKKEIAKTLYALAKNEKAQEVEEVLLTGEGGTFTGLLNDLRRDLSFQITTPGTRDGFDEEMIQLFAIPIGLALSAQPNAQSQINLRQGEFSYPHPWKRYKKPLTLYLLSCLALAITLYFLGNAWISYRTSSVQNEFATTLENLEIPYTKFQQDFYQEVYRKAYSASEIPPLNSYTVQDLQERLLFLERKIRQSPNTFPLYPNVPRVSDVLAWLASHPLVTGPNPNQPLLNIEGFSYSLVKMPVKGKVREPYQAKVELEFSTPLPKYAREFRDALMQPNDIIDTGLEIKWSSSRDIYRTSFFLKDQTAYP